MHHSDSHRCDDDNDDDDDGERRRFELFEIDVWFSLGSFQNVWIFWIVLVRRVQMILGRFRLFWKFFAQR